MKALWLKALRDTWHLRTQALAIAFVIAGGVANLVMSRSCYDSLQETRARFYGEYAFADVFAQAKRVPEDVAARIAGIDGVATLETRIVAGATVQLEGYADPVRAQLVSLGDERGGRQRLNRLYLRAGRVPEPAARREAVLSEAFAEAHGFEVGGTLAVTVNGRRERLTVVGIALSPEYVYQIQPGAAFPDFKRFAVIWLDRRALAAALDMDGAFNHVVATLAPGRAPQPVLDALDALLGRYGGLGAYARADQLSNRFLGEELRQLGTMAWLFPTIFLGVAVFLLNVVLTRLVDTQRDQIAILKAFGYRDLAIALHYAVMVAVIVALGCALGIGGGALLGRWLAGVYQGFYRFPFLDWALGAGVIGLGIGLSLGAALAGTAGAVWRAARMPPAEAMRPPTPERYRMALLERAGLSRLLGQPTRIVLRNLERRPWRSLLSIVGLALACAIMMIGRFQENAIDHMIDAQYRYGQRNDLFVVFVEPTARTALFELAAIPGVRLAEPLRTVPVRLRHGQHMRRVALEGLVAQPVLKIPTDIARRRIEPPTHGLLLTDFLAEALGVAPGDLVTVEVLQGRRRVLDVPVAGLVQEYLGINAYMELGALNRLLGDGDAMSGALLALEPGMQEAVSRELERRPRVAGIGARLAAIRNFYDTLAESMLVFTFVSLVLGGVINFGVVYNSARIALSERGRDLASLRVLGFTRGEVAYILFAELALLVAIATPLGFAAGYGLCWIMAEAFQSDLYRVPLHVTPITYAFAALTMLGSTLMSAAIVARRVRRLDLVDVLKTRE